MFSTYNDHYIRVFFLFCQIIFKNVIAFTCVLHIKIYISPSKKKTKRKLKIIIIITTEFNESSMTDFSNHNNYHPHYYCQKNIIKGETFENFIFFHHLLLVLNNNNNK